MKLSFFFLNFKFSRCYDAVASNVAVVVVVVVAAVVDVVAVVVDVVAVVVFTAEA